MNEQPPVPPSPQPVVPPPTPPPEPPKTSRYAVTSLVLGILSLTCCWCLTGVPAVIFGALALSQIRAAAGMITGRGMAIAGVITGSLGIIISILCLTLSQTLQHHLPAMLTSFMKSDSGQMAQCAINETQIGGAIARYAGDHNNQLPLALDELKPYGLSTQMLICPSSPDQTNSSYILTGATNVWNAGNTIIILRENPLNHHGLGGYVLYDNGRIGWVPKQPGE